MRKWVASIAILVCFFALPAQADTELLTDGGFETGTAGNNFNVGPQYVYADTGPFNAWFDVNQWQYASGGVGGSLFAKHVASNQQTNLLYQFVDVSGGIGGTDLTLALDWAFEGGAADRDVWVLGLGGHTDWVQKFANWFPGNDGNAPPGAVLLHWDTSTELPVTSSGNFTHLFESFTVSDPGAYDALVVAIKVASGSSGSSLRGVDNVSLSVQTPEPTSLVLLALAGGWFLLRRRR